MCVCVRVSENYCKTRRINKKKIHREKAAFHAYGESGTLPSFSPLIHRNNLIIFSWRNAFLSPEGRRARVSVRGFRVKQEPTASDSRWASRQGILEGGEAAETQP